mmetsp:Transcript_6691/g.21659  ORF Transcript_6691/g.21659 Transcript_6691/m.21659 type:complete len:228 (-) Transcript_6691:143-826(-)
MSDEETSQAGVATRSGHASPTTASTTAYRCTSRIRSSSSPSSAGAATPRSTPWRATRRRNESPSLSTVTRGRHGSRPRTGRSSRSHTSSHAHAKSNWSAHSATRAREANGDQYGMVTASPAARGRNVHAAKRRRSHDDGPPDLLMRQVHAGRHEWLASDAGTHRASSGCPVRLAVRSPSSADATPSSLASASSTTNALCCTTCAPHESSPSSHSGSHRTPGRHAGVK